MYNLFNFFTGLFLLFAFNSSFANIDVQVPEVIILQSDNNLGIIYSHELQKNQTVYGLAKFFNTSMSRIEEANPQLNFKDIKLNQRIYIPINTNMISSERNLSPSKKYIPVFYTVKAKDNLFRISKVYFNQRIENVMNINNLESMSLSIGQRILVGWYEYDPIYKERLSWKAEGIEVDAVESSNSATNNNEAPVFKKVIKENNTPSENKVFPTKKMDVVEKPEKSIEDSKIIPPTKKEASGTDSNVGKEASNETSKELITKNEMEDETETTKTDVKVELSSDPFKNRNNIYEGDYENKPAIVSEKIRAEWNMKSRDRVNLFALHASAKKGSFIEIYNPMMDTKVIAKVVGNLPPKAHKKNVELIISPKVAETLGAVDKRFYVKVRYIE